ncbi:MAG: methyltransferase domain-containing protein [Candidatus Omnitrophica bacterium]|nr:methyltransferase domain-containing protein [Candidatus Omnitrophota bacterium]MDD5552299.1 methyltransferase domain-containing protein [Candidatus Omnitrophota bacterium]
MNKEIIARNFSRYAHLYDRFADIQKRAALEIIGGMENDGFSDILEIGCGTGNYTLLLRDKFKEASLTAVDISPRMIDIARDKLGGKRINFLAADAEVKDLTAEKYDLITSNACFQWFEDLGKAIQTYRLMLKEKGTILFSIFGPLTFWELNAALGETMKRNIPAEKFLNKDKIIEILRENFRSAGIEEAVYEESFASLRDLLMKIKYSGINGGGLAGKVQFSRRSLRDLERTYLDKFQRMKATYQVFFCRGQAG